MFLRIRIILIEKRITGLLLRTRGPKLETTRTFQVREDVRYACPERRSRNFGRTCRYTALRRFRSYCSTWHICSTDFPIPRSRPYPHHNTVPEESPVSGQYRCKFLKGEACENPMLKSECRTANSFRGRTSIRDVEVRRRRASAAR